MCAQEEESVRQAGLASGRSRDTGKSSGQSSPVEAAPRGRPAGDPRAMPELPAYPTGVFPEVIYPGEPDALGSDTAAAGSSPITPFAVASVVAALMLIAIPMTSLVAVITGHIALRRIRQADEALGGRVLAMTGLIVGYLELALVLGLAVVAAVLVFG